MNRPLLAAALGVVAGLVLAVPALLLREFGWHLHGGRQLVPAPEMARLRVDVVDARTGAPVHEAWVWIDGEMNRGAPTGPDGSAVLETTPGDRLLVADFEGTGLEGRVVALAPGETHQVLRLRPGFRINGRVELPDGGPAAGAKLDVRPLEWPGMTVAVRSADEGGRFAVQRLGLEGVRLEASLEGVGRAVKLVRAPAEDVTLRLTPGEPPGLPGETEPDDPTAEFPREGERITVHQPDGGVAAGAWVLEVGERTDGGTPGRLRRRAQLRVACTTGRDGSCLAPPGGGCLLASAWPHADSEVTCGAGRTGLRLRAGEWLTGTVHGPAAAGGWIQDEDGATAVVDPDGGFALGPVHPGPHVLRAFDSRGHPAGGLEVQVPSPMPLSLGTP
ncbi:MAG: hypothetical protein RL653_3873 [Pseudomonadota bacterium]|jgi:hypothetical protein